MVMDIWNTYLSEHIAHGMVMRMYMLVSYAAVTMLRYSQRNMLAYEFLMFFIQILIFKMARIPCMQSNTLVM